MTFNETFLLMGGCHWFTRLLLGQQPCARESAAGMDGAFIDQIRRPATHYSSAI